MNWLDNIELYLRLKLESNPSRQSFGVKFLGEYPESLNHLRVFGQIAHHVISSQAITKEGVTKCKLTNVSISIGKRIISIISSPKLHDWKEEVRVGDLMVETFYQLGFIDVKRPAYKSSLPVEIELLKEFPTELPPEYVKMVLHGTWSSRPRHINRLEQVIQFDSESPRYTKAIMKRWDEKLDGLFKSLLNTKAIRALDKLQQVGWRIDKDILDAILKNPELFYIKGDKSDNNLSKILDYNYTVNKAKALADTEEFFYALDMDYRGRVYYVESYINFQGSDIARGMLKFSEKRTVTPEGIRWIKIHCACSYNQSYSIDSIPEWCTSDYKRHLMSEGLEDISVDKMTLKDRELWCDNNLDKIYETAINSKLHNCEKPVSFLAACKEIYNYYHCDDDIYLSDLPIPIDGSNNGWQHLGAISKDVQTGELVGLVPVGIQNDFYVQTAKKLIEITKDERRLEILKSMPMKKIRKGISKRGSMTRAYSAGAQKIAENMYNDCNQAGYVAEFGITEGDCKGFARDLVKAIEQVCPGPLKTMKFFQDLVIAKLNEGWGYVSWITPSGFPVVYTCQHQVSERQRGTIQGVGQIKHVAKVDSLKPDMRGFVCGISPNFIHSQDASHMSLVIDAFEGSFGAVHDSFSTHASDVDELCLLTKQVFIDMYDKANYFDIIEEKIGSSAEQPTLGTLNINNVEKSDYFFA